jgi:hypothetical protein
MRPYQSNQEDEDPDIKKIKKVGHWRVLALWEHGDQLSVLWKHFCHCAPGLGIALVFLC